jgi:hypothetical protein
MTAYSQLAFRDNSVFHYPMSTTAEIETAIERLPAIEREALEARLLTRRFGLDALNDDERAELLESLDTADREIAAGDSHSGDDLRKAVRQWAGR